MTDNIYHYVVPLPEGINEAVRPCIDGYTIYTADRLDHEGTERAIIHALRHIRNHDFETEISVTAKEIIAHQEDCHESLSNLHACNDFNSCNNGTNFSYNQ